MRKSDLNYLRDWFYAYIAGFYGSDDYIDANLELKKVHTEYVIDEARYVAGGIGLAENDILIAETVGLMHDVGRFEQFFRYRTYSDYKSINHNDLAVDVIRAEGVLDRLCEAEREMIVAAVKYHGKKALPDGLDERTLLHCKIIRDADKLDIYRVLREKYMRFAESPEDFNLELEYPDEPEYSEHIAQAIFNNEQVSYTELKTLNDMKLLNLAMVFDVNFRPTFKKIMEKGYIQTFIDMLPADDTIYKVKDTIIDYIEQRLGEERNT